MTSQLTMEEFELRLHSLTHSGQPWVMSSPLAIFSIFGDVSRPFYGEINNRQFRVTRNSIMPFENTYYMIKGEYCSDENTYVKVNYQLQPLRFHYFAVRIVAVILVLSINLALYLSNETPFQGWLLANGFVILFCFARFRIESATKAKLEARFKRELRINLN